jgi:hypothetical protein
MAEESKRQSNKDFAKNSDFVKLCEEAGTPATSRQASKYRRGYGKVAQMKK